MYQKAVIFVILIFVIPIFCLANELFTIQSYPILPTQKVLLLDAATDNFINIGYLICAGCWIFMNSVVLKTKQLFWIWIPLLFVVIVALLTIYFEEYLFDFIKQNGLWKGGFSVSFIVEGIIIFTAIIGSEINYFALKNYLKNNQFKFNSSKNTLIS